MLNNHSDYHGNPDEPVTPPTFYASTDDRINRLRNDYGIDKVKHYVNRHKSAQAQVPSVVGYSLRDAINKLENMGVDVSFTGSGYVVSQSLAPGTSIREGSKVHLTLKQ